MHKVTRSVAESRVEEESKPGGEAGTRQKEVGQKRSSSKRPQITRELKAINVVGAQRESQVCGEK